VKVPFKGKNDLREAGKMTMEERVKAKFFAGVRTFDRNAGGFTVLPLILRRCQFLFPSPRHWQCLCYVMMRTGKAGVAWFSLKEMAWDLDFHSLPKLRPYLNRLIEDGWIKHAITQGQDYYVVVDPFVVIEEMKAANRISDERLGPIEDLAAKLRKPRPTAPSPEPLAPDVVDDDDPEAALG
jgi:hypothetical protein